MKRARNGEPFGHPCDSIAIGSDHGGFELKKKIVDYINEKYKSKGISIRDVGTTSEENKADYPDICGAVCSLLQKGEVSRGILLDGAGVASGIAANKFIGIRCAVVHDHFSISMGRKHNDCNVMSLGGKSLGIEAAKEIVDVFISCEFEGDRHIPRLNKICSIESKGGRNGGDENIASPLKSPFKLPM